LGYVVLPKVVIGKITGVHGVRGDIKVMPYTQTPKAMADYQPWLIGTQPYHPAQVRINGKGLIVKLKGCDDRDVAKTLVGTLIEVERKQLPELTTGYYWSDLAGLTVTTQNGVLLGKISHLFETGANDVMVVNGEKERLIPYRLDEVIISVDLDQGTMVVAWDPSF